MFPRNALPDGLNGSPGGFIPGLRAVRDARRAGHARKQSERYCRELTRREAANFYWGFVALPRPKRTAIYALYSFARQVDDDIDLQGETACDDVCRRHLGRIAGEPASATDDPVMHVLGDVVRTYHIPASDLEALVRGVQMDVRQRRYQTWEELRTYCEHVASSVGRMCVHIFGYSDSAALAFADDLGVAMQLANILRDVREDLRMGRVYLPQDDLARFGVSEDALWTEHPGDGWEALVAFEIERAQRLFASGTRVTTVIPRRASACVLTMAGIYEAILREIARDPYRPLQDRISLDKRSKVSVMARSWLQAM